MLSIRLTAYDLIIGVSETLCKEKTHKALLPVNEWPKINSLFGIRSLGVVVLVIDSFVGSISFPRSAAWSACILYHL
jgi:hypothetical protein